MPNYKLQPISLLYVQTELKNHICNRFYSLSCEGPVSMERVLKNAGYQRFDQLPGNFFRIFFRCREILPSTIYMPNFRSIGPFKQKLQRRGGGGGEGGQNLRVNRSYQSAKSLPCLGLKNVSESEMWIYVTRCQGDVQSDIAAHL